MYADSVVLYVLYVLYGWWWMWLMMVAQPMRRCKN